MTVAIPATTFAVPVRWRMHLSVVAAVAAAILLIFARDLSDMVGIWWTSSTFGHCLLIAPILGWLVWQRREQLAELEPVAWWPGLLLVSAGGAQWWLGQAASVAFARQFALVLMLIGAVVTLLGPRVARGLAFPLGYALFLVPFGDWLEAPLQAITVRLVMPLLALAGIPASADGVMIHAGRYYFEVAEACSGAKFVIAMAAFGVLVAQVGFRSRRRRFVWLAACLVVPVLANGLRAFATILAADLTDVETAGGFDHIVYGWVFFALVVAGMLAVAWRFFDRPADDPAFDPETLKGPVRPQLPLIAAAALVMAGAGVFPVWAAAVESRTAAAPLIVLPDIPGWHRVSGKSSAAWRPWYPGAALSMQRYADGHGRAVDVAVAAYPRQAEGRELVGYGVGVLRAEDRWLRVNDAPAVAAGSAMWITAPGPVRRLVTSWYRIGDTLTASPVDVKLATLRGRLFGGSQQAVALHLSAEAIPNGPDPAGSIEALLRAAGSPRALIARSVR
ncbi:exosortase A [Sphingomonas aerophila]|uniref:Exosortase A n=1 Tax=Sphingomonas aerophila TaxID=1344948 RepID=A0A7W9BDS8_9SPHN|nr:exosortase A [Sphingomonas aerophila]